MIDLKDAKDFFDLLHASDINYFVCGGVGLDAIRGNITRPHNDIDVYVFEEDLGTLFQNVKEKGYQCFRNLKKFEARKGDFVVELYPLKKTSNRRMYVGNAADISFPESIFSLDNFRALENVKLRVAPNELLCLESQFSKHPKDVQYGKSLPCNEEALSQIQYTKKAKPNNIKSEPV